MLVSIPLNSLYLARRFGLKPWVAPKPTVHGILSTSSLPTIYFLILSLEFITLLFLNLKNYAFVIIIYDAQLKYQN